MLKSIFAQDKPVGWRLESVEPNIIRHGDWINLYVSFLVFYGCLRFCRKIVRLNLVGFILQCDSMNHTVSSYNFQVEECLFASSH